MASSMESTFFGTEPRETNRMCLCVSLVLRFDLLVFRTRGVPGPTSKLSPRAPVQMGWRETEREGGKKPEGDRRKRGIPRPSCLSRA
jgi:hypothetical protein